MNYAVFASLDHNWTVLAASHYSHHIVHCILRSESRETVKLHAVDGFGNSDTSWWQYWQETARWYGCNQYNLLWLSSMQCGRAVAGRRHSQEKHLDSLWPERNAALVEKLCSSLYPFFCFIWEHSEHPLTCVMTKQIIAAIIFFVARWFFLFFFSFFFKSQLDIF